jgi:hypothetical protein
LHSNGNQQKRTRHQTGDNLENNRMAVETGHKSRLEQRHRFGNESRGTIRPTDTPGEHSNPVDTRHRRTVSHANTSRRTTRCRSGSFASSKQAKTTANHCRIPACALRARSQSKPPSGNPLSADPRFSRSSARTSRTCWLARRGLSVSHSRQFNSSRHGGLGGFIRMDRTKSLVDGNLGIASSSKNVPTVVVPRLNGQARSVFVPWRRTGGLS